MYNIALIDVGSKKSGIIEDESLLLKYNRANAQLHHIRYLIYIYTYVCK